MNTTQKEFIKALKTNYENLCIQFKQFDILKTLSFYSLLLGLFSIIFVGILAALSFKSQEAQYITFLWGYHFSKIASFVQVALQGVILVSLSYYTTVIWSGTYFPKLIVIAAIGILITLFQLFKTIFVK